MRKRLLTAAMAAMMVVGSVFPSMAYEYETGSTEIIREQMYVSPETGYVPTSWASGQVMKFPGWAWINGYCYYFTDYGYENKLTSCTTPDGYEVDAEGRWCVNGVPQSNGYGSYVVGTDELYAGKSDEERWQIIHEKLEKLYAEHIPGDEFMIAMRATPDGVNGGLTKEGYSALSVIRGGDRDPAYISAYLGNAWNDSPYQYRPYRNEVIEQTVKLVCGDHVGQELFNDIRAAADPNNGETLIVAELDENGNWIFTEDGMDVKKKTIQNSDGIDPALFDLNKWNGRTTDYGKTIQIELEPVFDPGSSKTIYKWILNVMK